MKSLFLSLALWVCCASAFAQTTVTGKVVDKKGEPIPGAKVQVKGTGTSVLTNMDGTFSIETTQSKPKLRATYVGWNTTIKKAGQGDNIIKMGKSSWWTEKPDHYQWFLGANVAFPGSAESAFAGVSPGIMFGRVKNVGWYIKGQFNGCMSGHDCNTWTTGKTKTNYMSGMGGIIVRLGCPIHLNLGFGYAKSLVGDEQICGSYSVRPNGHNGSYSGMISDMGVMLRIKHLFIHAGAQLELFHGADHAAGNFGIGYIF